jgi:2-polyprenyl-3-methyl-5-hydroxy-6-metoxy-1,4-benzoquinol methylase
LHVTAYDVSPHSLSFSQRVLVGAGFSDVEFVLADVTREEMPAVDFVICSELLEHVSEPQVLVNRAASSLRSGGAIFLTAAVNAPQFDHLTRFTSPIEVMEIVRKSNLDVSDSQLFTPLSGRRSESPPQVLALLALRKGSADG